MWAHLIKQAVPAHLLALLLDIMTPHLQFAHRLYSLSHPAPAHSWARWQFERLSHLQPNRIKEELKANEPNN